MNVGFARAGDHECLANVNAHEWSRHPFVMRLLRYMDVDKAGLDRLRLLIESARRGSCPLQQGDASRVKYHSFLD